MTTPPPFTPHLDLRQVLDALPDPLFLVDGEWRLTFVNGPGAALAGRGGAELVGQTFWEVFPGLGGAGLEAELRRAALGGGVVDGAHLTPPGRWLDMRVLPLGGGLAVEMRDVTGRVLAERRARALSEVTAALARPLSRGEVTRAVLTHALPALGAYGGSVLRLTPDGRALEVEGTVGYDEAVASSWKRFDLTASLPVTVSVRGARAVFARNADLARDYPDLLAAGASATRSLAALPLRYGERVSGALALSFAADHAFDGAERQFMEDMAALCAQALERAHAADAGERAARHARALVDLGAELTGAASPGEVARAVVRHGREASGAYGSALYVLEEGGEHLREIERQGYDAPIPEAWRRFGLDTPHLPALVAKGAEAIFLQRAELEARYPQAPRAPRTRAVAVLPLAVRGRLLGVLGMAYAHEPEFDDLKRGFLTSLAAQAALALERARQVAAVRAAERRYRSLVEAGGQIVWVTNARGEFVAGQPQWEAFTGQTPAESRGSGWAGALHPGDREATLRAWRGSLDTRTPCAVEHRVRRADGTYVWFDLRAVPVLGEGGEVQEWVGVEADATARRAREAEVRSGEERYRTLSNVTNDAIWDWTFDGDRLAWNEGFYSLFGYRRDEVEPTGAWWKGRIHPGDRERVVRGIEAVIRGLSPEWRGEYRFARADGSYATVLDRGQVMRDDQGRAVRMIGGMTDLSGRERHREEIERLNASLERRVEERTGELRLRAAELQAETDALSAFAAFTQSVGDETDLARLAGRAVDTLVRAYGEASAVYYERNEDERGDVWTARVWAGDLDPGTLELARRGFPVHALTPDLTRAAASFVGGWATMGGEVGELTPQYGAAAFFPVWQDGELRGLLTAGLRRAQAWTPRDEAVFRAVGQGLAVAAERGANLRRLEEERAATAAFAAFTERVGTETHLPTLARQAVEVLHTALSGVNVGYYELEGGRWMGRALSEDVPPEVARAAREGFPADTQEFEHAASAPGVLFVDGWDGEAEGMGSTSVYGAAAFFPYHVGGRPYGLLTMASPGERQWTPRARAVFSSVARGLSLAFERAETARALQEQNAELNVRTRALEGFAELARDLAFETDPAALVRRAQEIIMTLLPGGVAFYYEPDGSRWRVRVQTGDLHNGLLQNAIDAGLPFEETGNLIGPWRTGEPYYQETYDLDTDNLAAHTGHIGSTAAVPILVRGEPRGVLAVALFGARSWDATDRAVVETAARHLSLALERAAVAGELERQRAELRAANEELEAFSYSVSHDLRAPLRHIGGFSGLLRRAVEAGDTARSARALDVIDASITRSNTLIDALLEFSHASRRDLRREPVDLGALVGGLREEAQQEAGDREVQWAVAPLPTVPGDPALLRQVLSNLLSNAVKYSARSEHIRVEVGSEEHPDETVVFVRDSGAGFDPRYADRLFGVFQRLHHEGEFQGTGIGLATVRRIVARHGGRVWAQGGPGQGATFFFSLPRA